MLLVTPSAIHERDAFLVVIILFAYLLLSLWFPLGEGNEKGSPRNRVSFILRYAFILIIAADAVISPTLVNIYERIITPVEYDGYSPALIDLSDSALQTEVALAYLTAGKNPYVERYEDTPLRFYQWVNPGLEEWQDPAYEYFVYLPGTLLLSLPFYLMANSLGVPFYDQRLVYLLSYIVLLLVLPHLVKPPAYKLALVAAVGLTPLFTNPVVLGMNDVAPFLALVIAMLLLVHRHFVWAACLLGIACALKQYAWFIVPFYLLYVWQNNVIEQRKRILFLTILTISAVMAIVFLPFFLWDPWAFYLDTFAFPAGRADLLYPIRGFTIGRLLMGVGVIPTFVSPFPFQLLQVIFCVPLALLLLRYQSGRNLGEMLLASAIFIFGFGIFSRFFHHNYVGVVVVLALLGIIIGFANAETMPDQESPDFLHDSR